MLIFLLGGQSNIFQAESVLRTYMEDSAGMAENAEVRLNGIYIGHIFRVQLSGSQDPKRTVEIHMKISRKYLDLIPDDSRRPSAPPICWAISTSTSPRARIRSMWRPVANRFVQTQDIPEILAQASGLLSQFQTILGRVDGILAVVDSGQGNLGKLFKDDSLYDRLNATAGEVEQLVKDVKNSNGTISHLLYDDTLYNEIRSPIQRLDDMLAQVQQGKGSAGKLLYDPALYDEARASLTEAKKMLDDLNAGKGTAGKLLKDEDVYKQLDLMTQKVNMAIDKINSGQGTIGQLMVNPQLYDSINGVAREMNSLLADVHKDPKKFLRIKLAILV